MPRRDTCPQESKHLSCVSEDPLLPHTQSLASS
ncbi:rCG60018 [Rattus norvegicus]|uniref:RCG60018 n=1 Tax=Rattus norvegicus TaxID=10116 RepID=A6HTE8_RAT|nr:rCG60018 [Rattus norvegicus]